MPKTMDEAFKALSYNLEITGLQTSTVSTRQQAVRAVLDRGLTVKEDFLTGSYRRSTLIAPLKTADVDVFVVLDPKYHKADGQAELLDTVCSVLRKTYTRTSEIRPDGQAVTVTFDDFGVDVVPGFYRKGGGYLIPDADRSRWISTDPKKHVELWSAANTAHDGKLVPLMKMLKGWNISRKVLKSFHLEALTLSALNNVTISSMPSGVRFVFDKARAAVTKPLADPAGYGGDVGQYAQARSEKIVERLDWAYARAREAEVLAQQGDVKGAFEKWALIFKDYFPGYR